MLKSDANWPIPCLPVVSIRQTRMNRLSALLLSFFLVGVANAQSSGQARVQVGVSPILSLGVAEASVELAEDASTWVSYALTSNAPEAVILFEWLDPIPAGVDIRAQAIPGLGASTGVQQALPGDPVILVHQFGRGLDRDGRIAFEISGDAPPFEARGRLGLQGLGITRWVEVPFSVR